jgi:hypothetical protein
VWKLVLILPQLYYPYLLMNKKRYVGLLWTNPNKHDKMDSKVSVCVGYEQQYSTCDSRCWCSHMSVALVQVEPHVSPLSISW